MTKEFVAQPSAHLPVGAERTARQTTWLILAGAAIMFLILQLGVTLLISVVDQTWSALIATAAMVAFVFAFERLALARRPVEAVRALGWVRSNFRAVLVAVVVSAAMLLFYPLASLIIGAPIALRSDWLWILVGAIVLNGIGEETLFRGFIFGHLRRAGMSFVRASLIALVIFTMIHLLLFVQNPFVVALAGTLIALVASFPFAYLFERAGFSIWPTVILHVAAHSIRLVAVPEPYSMTILVAWLVVQIGMPFLIWAFRSNLLKERPSGTL
jgi:membrane protease YdiL (CAAX protease family)